MLLFLAMCPRNVIRIIDSMILKKRIILKELASLKIGISVTDPFIMDPATIEQCIIDQSKRKLKLLEEIETCNRTIENLRKLQELQDNVLKDQ